MFLDPIVAKLHERANRRRRRIEFRDAVFGANLPESSGVWVERNALEDDTRGRVEKWAVDQVAVAWVKNCRKRYVSRMLPALIVSLTLIRTQNN